MKKYIFIGIGLCALTSINAQTINRSQVVSDAEKQTSLLLQLSEQAHANKKDQVSPRTEEKGSLKLVSSRDWTSGFFPGNLWYLYELTHKETWKADAQKYTAYIAREQWNGDTHDMGFKIYCSFGNGYRLTKDTAYRNVIVQAAKTLSRRFNTTAGVIKSWDNRKEWPYPVIIDNMMNLELLFAASKLTGDTSFRHIAVTHARTTMRNHFRGDYSSYHVLDYDTLTGAVKTKTTHQGYSSESAWARGQAWGLYGFTMCYRETKDPAFLNQAEHIAQYILHQPNMPADKIPYWDYSAPDTASQSRDASAAAITASALYELAQYSKKGKLYKATADTILQNLTNFYRAAPGSASGFLLLHSTGHRPANSEIDVPIIYADYYYLEALLRSNAMHPIKS